MTSSGVGTLCRKGGEGGRVPFRATKGQSGSSSSFSEGGVSVGVINDHAGEVEVAVDDVAADEVIPDHFFQGSNCAGELCEDHVHSGQFVDDYAFNVDAAVGKIVDGRVFNCYVQAGEVVSDLISEDDIAVEKVVDQHVFEGHVVKGNVSDRHVISCSRSCSRCRCRCRCCRCCRMNVSSKKVVLEDGVLIVLPVDAGMRSFRLVTTV